MVITYDFNKDEESRIKSIENTLVNLGFTYNKFDEYTSEYASEDLFATIGYGDKYDDPYIMIQYA